MSTITQMTAVPADAISAPPPAAKPTEGDAAAPAPSGTASAAAPAAGSSPDDTQRLLISEGPEAGVLIYTIVDRVSGRVLVQIPREQVEQIASRSDYTAGTVIDTKA